MRGDEQRHAHARELKQQVPQLPPRHRINARRRLVEEQHAWFVHQRAGHRQPLPPAARKQRGPAMQVRFEMRKRDQFVAPPQQRRAAQSIEAPIKHQVFVHGQFVVKRKFLRHVTDERFDAVGFARHVVPGNGRAAVVRLQQPAQHADDRGFAGPVGSQKTENGAFADRETDMIDRGKVAELFCQVFTRDHGVNRHRGAN